ncbi:MAG: redoxin domain-containing protein [Chitinophagales bacterium]
MRSRQLLYIFIVISVLAACSGSERRFHIIGDIAGMPEQTVILEQLNANDIITIVDSEHSKADGHFELSGVAPEPGLYRLHLHPNKFILLSVDKGNLKIDAKWHELEDYTVSGSPASEHLRNFIIAIREHLRDYNTMSIILDTLQTKGNDSILGAAKKDFEDMRLHFTQFVEHYADTAPYEPNAVFAARILNSFTESTYLYAFSQGLTRRFPGTKITQDFAEYYAKTSAKHKHEPIQPVHTDSGTVAPEVTLPSTDGKMVTLSSFKGKYVLLDFWASWCAPCRGENPNVVAAYEKFKDKNFTIFGVSLDNNKEAWEKAIKDDSLTWTQVSDLKGWSSAAATTYAVQSIPTNFLIDPKGRIIAHNLRGEELIKTLEGIFK